MGLRPPEPPGEAEPKPPFPGRPDEEPPGGLPGGPAGRRIGPLGKCRLPNAGRLVCWLSPRTAALRRDKERQPLSYAHGALIYDTAVLLVGLLLLFFDGLFLDGGA